MIYILLPILVIIVGFFVFSVYSNRQARYAQKVRAFELRKKHMEKTMEKIKIEIEDIQKEISVQQDKINDLESDKDVTELS